jgi:hypothetical protein
VPPAVAPMNYKSSGLLWRIFCQTGIFAGFSLHIINLAVRISATMMAGDVIFLGCRTAYKGAMDGARGGEYYISTPLWFNGKIYASGSPSPGLKKREPLCFWKFRGVFSVYYVGRISEAAMGGRRSSFRARRSSLGRVHRSSVRCNVAQSGAA